MKTKFCNKCQQTKAISLFSKARSKCKACDRDYRILNKERNRIQKQDYYERTKTERLAYAKVYAAKHKQEYQQYVQTHKERINANQRASKAVWRKHPHNRIMSSCRTRIGKALNNKKKIRHTIELLGCSVVSKKTY
jgi:hypothetical protein